MTTEDLQGQVARSAAVERELREQIGKLREELAEARRHAREYRELYEEAEPRLRAALAEASGPLPLARRVIAAFAPHEQALLARIDAALAHAGEQGTPEPRCMAVTRNGHRCDLGPHEEADDYHEAENAAEGGGTLRWSERYAPAPAGEPASGGQEVYEDFRSPQCATPPPGEQGAAKKHRCMRCGGEFACRTEGCEAGYDVLPSIVQRAPDGSVEVVEHECDPAGGQGKANYVNDVLDRASSTVKSWPAYMQRPEVRELPGGEQGKGADALTRLRAERDRYNETEGESGEMPLLEALDAFLDAEPEQGKGGGEGWQAMVREFHAACGVPTGDSPAVRRPELRASLIEEEAKETAAALRAGDLVQTIDGLCDVIYVALGCAVECGIDLAPFFAEVHRSNMQKAGGPRRADGKILKPPGWTPPDIAGLLR